MKIAVYGQFESYGCMGVWVADGLEEIGHKVTRIDRRDIILEPSDYSVIFCVDCSEDYSAHIPKCDKAVKVFWSMDAHMPGGEERSVNMSRKCDLVFSSNYEYGVKILERNGIGSYLLPITYNPRLIMRVKERKDIDVAMIGHPNSEERLRLWQMLMSFNSFTGKADTDQRYSDIMRATKIVVNQPTEPFDMILNNRFFEALAFGKKLFQKRLKTTLIEKLGFIEAVDFEYWDTIPELRRKIASYLDDDYNENVVLKSTVEKAKRISIPQQCLKVETILLSKFYDRLRA